MEIPGLLIGFSIHRSTECWSIYDLLIIFKYYQAPKINVSAP